ncbi:MAG: (Fe-S)-binding protein [Candidatus Thiodiazotropha weberae]|nr:(Fe-S)-binding protein [Candidatus Thiodiazotropha lotti]MCG8011188.1 (Fe-S)-binding protein [Candidatus Thiodiazotropha lotti]MCG8020246.1 (Fe-S)-binding protein [Candidatus Thiodiazotropha lotti]MCW4207409.1 (Fe-S)-binding protein [Candidatus Thiodiazotropha lotti]MCW4210650.1 (Fe-S)-binding protein [Candidatus Thiodiazotropha lotti]
MNDFRFESFSTDYGFDGLSLDNNQSLGPYIPDTQECLSCGVCVGSCPTYRIRPEENYGPRGRIRLLEKAVRKGEALDMNEQAALASCTLCQACETLCPSKMAFAELYRQALEGDHFKPSKSLLVSWILALAMGGETTRRRLNHSIRIYQRSGLPRLFALLAKLPFLKSIQPLLVLLPTPHDPQPIAGFAQTRVDPPLREVILFTGCIASLFDTRTHNATTTLLSRIGCDVTVVENQTCCGAAYAHNGEMSQAKVCLEQNLTAFTNSSTVIYNSSGCGAFLNDYPALMGCWEKIPDEIPSFLDVLDYLDQSDLFHELQFNPLQTQAVVHEPCSQRNALKNQTLAYRLLAKIPGLKITSLTDNQICCGAGGTKMVTQPELANPMRDEKVAALTLGGADILVTTNLTCALHLASGARDAGFKGQVMHPVQLLAQQLID